VGIKFRTRPYRPSLLLADLDVDGELNSDGLHGFVAGPGLLFLFPFPASVAWRLLTVLPDTDLGDLDGVGDLAGLQLLVDQFTDGSLHLHEPEWSTQVRLRRGQADRYRRGRLQPRMVMLAGSRLDRCRLLVWSLGEDGGMADSVTSERTSVGSGPPGGRALPLLSVVALALLPLGQVTIVIGLLGAVLAAVVGIAGVRVRCWVAVRVAVMALLMAVIGLAGVPFSLWLAVGALWLASRRWRSLRPDGGWFPPGHPSRAARVMLVATVVGTTAALSLWVLSEPALGESTRQLAELARRTPSAVVAVFVVVFVLVNPLIEEIAYRLLVFDAARSAMSVPAALVVQAVAFGTLHVVGFPAGAIGVALSFVYGLALGVIRVMTGGLRLAMIAHIAANATIAALVLALLVPQ
jgi:uncharacterized protein